MKAIEQYIMETLEAIHDKEIPSGVYCLLSATVQMVMGVVSKNVLESNFYSNGNGFFYKRGEASWQTIWKEMWIESRAT